MSHEEVATGRRGKGEHFMDKGPEAGKSLACCRERDACGRRLGTWDKAMGELSGMAEPDPLGPAAVNNSESLLIHGVSILGTSLGPLRVPPAEV